MTKHDKYLLGILLVFLIFSYPVYFLVNREASSLTAEISVNGNTISRIDLNNPPPERLINITGPIGTSVAEVKPGAIRMKFSPCPDQYCMKTGWIDRPGQIIVCVPNRIIIKISPDKNPVDTISH
ncbi:MAG: NusG domain II-containing protein [Syntrophomonadaceae bacterium]|nr:NusG domain II-containing protein [Syntrophomonadaceae bacterium]